MREWKMQEWKIRERKRMESRQNKKKTLRYFRVSARTKWSQMVFEGGS